MFDVFPVDNGLLSHCEREQVREDIEARKEHPERRGRPLAGHGVLDLLPTSRSAIGYYYFGANYVVHADASFTLDRRIASGDVLTRREPRGRQRRVYVALDDDPPENSAYAEPSLAATPLGLLPPS